MSEPPTKKMKNNNNQGASKEDLDEDFLNWKDYMKKEQTKLVAGWTDETWVQFWVMANQQEISPTVDTVIDGLEDLRHGDAILDQKQRLSQPSNNGGFHEKCAGCKGMTG